MKEEVPPTNSEDIVMRLEAKIERSAADFQAFFIRWLTITQLGIALIVVAVKLIR